MKSFATAILLVLAFLQPATAQVVPGMRSDFDEAAAQYRSYALGEFQEVVDDWVGAVNTGRIDQAEDLYTEDAYLEIAEPARGREAVGELLESWGADVRQLQVGLSDFDASGNMAYGTLQVRLSPRTGSVRTGTLLLVMRKDGRSWRIRAQTLNLL